MKTFDRWLVLGSIALGVAISAAPAADAAQAIGTTTVTPLAVRTGVSTLVTVTAVIDEASLIAPSVVLQRVDDTGRVVASLGALVDDGTNGDAVAGDKTFSRQVTIFEPVPGPVLLRVSAAFLGKLTRAFSSTVTVDVAGSAAAIPADSPGNLAFAQTDR